MSKPLKHITISQRWRIIFDYDGRDLNTATYYNLDGEQIGRG